MMAVLQSSSNSLRCFLLFQSFIIASSYITLTAGDDVTDAESVTVEHPSCRLFLAESTIPNAGLGIFTGIELRDGDAVAEPDIIVPLQDYEWHSSGNVDFHLIWHDYSWFTQEVKMESDMVDGHALVIGTGCMPNCNFALINAVEGEPDYDHAGLHRSEDAGIGGFTGFHNQRMHAVRTVPAGGELFVSYGEDWFKDREGARAVPFKRNFKKVDKLLKKFKRMSLKYQNGDNPDFTKDLWDVLKAQANHETRGGNALPLSFEDMQSAQTIGSAESRLPHSVRTLEWLEENGRCMDNIRPGNSTIEQAGRGAFAARHIPNGGLVAPGPVLHVANRTAMNLYGVGEDGHRNTSDPIGMQLILNYCFGHKKSTVLLCPYTSPSAYINHDGKSPNAKIVWADEDSTPNHNQYWLEEDVKFLKAMGRVGLSINFIATRDIQPGEEVFIDYGPEWEDAWDEHVGEWSAPPDSERYAPANTLQNDASTPLRTAAEQLSDPYPDNFVFYCHYEYEPGLLEGLQAWEDDWGYLPMAPCRILSRETKIIPHGDEGHHYAIVMLDEDELDGLTLNGMEYNIPSGENHVLVDVPRWAIEVRDRLYSKDEFMKNSFRHEMMMPDEIFPETWKNLQGKIIIAGL